MVAYPRYATPIRRAPSASLIDYVGLSQRPVEALSYMSIVLELVPKRGLVDD